jgi:hypothetical protein
MTQQHPITPTLKLFRKWTEYRGTETEDQFWWRIATQATQWGADQELEACCEWFQSFYKLESWMPRDLERLRATRRPKPPSLKEQALIHFESFAATFETSGGDSDLIRRALEQLND